MPVSPNVLMMHRSLSLPAANLGLKLGDSENRCEDDADVAIWIQYTNVTDGQTNTGR